MPERTPSLLDQWLSKVSPRSLGNFVLSLLGILAIGAVGKMYLAGQALQKSPLTPDGFRFIDGKWTDSAKKRGSAKLSKADTVPRLALVHIAGAVKTPGLYKILDNVRVVDALKLAGGALPGANLNMVNLAAFVYDGQRVYLPSKKTTKPKRDRVARKATIEKRSYENPLADKAHPVELNSATREELMKIPEIGPTIAERILYYRSRVGKFYSIEELSEVPGISESKFVIIMQFVYVKGASSSSAKPR